jgi:chromosome segregation ATPase
MTVDRVIEILLALMTITIGYASFSMATRSTRSEKESSIRSVDAGAFERARVIYEGALDTLRDELVACRAELAVAHTALETLRSELSTAHYDLTAARREIAGLRSDISALQADMDVLRRLAGGEGNGRSDRT